ncbi:MAG: putative signal transducing protein [Actinomycetota bacterium]
MTQRVGTLEPAPPQDGSSHGGGGRWVWLVTARNVFEAEILKGVLEGAGVPVMDSSFDSSPFAWMYPAGNPNVPVKLFVPASLLEAARLELLESSFDEIAPEPLAPPVVATRHLTSGFHGRPFWIVLAAVLTSISLATVIAVEMFGRGACDSRVLCPEPKQDPSTHCEPAPLVVKGLAACVPNR